MYLNYTGDPYFITHILKLILEASKQLILGQNSKHILKYKK